MNQNPKVIFKSFKLSPPRVALKLSSLCIFPFYDNVRQEEESLLIYFRIDLQVHVP